MISILTQLSLHVFKIDERIVDGLNLNLWVLQSISENLSKSKSMIKIGKAYNSSDTAESVDSDADRHS